MDTSDEDDSGLVETPESAPEKPKRQRRSRKPREETPAVSEDSAADTGSDGDAGSQEAAE